MSEQKDVLGSDRDPSLALITNQTPEEIYLAWQYTFQNHPEYLRPKYQIIIEMQLGNSCQREDITSLVNDFGAIIGLLSHNRGTVVRNHNTVTFEAKMFEGYEAEVSAYLRNYICTFINSPANDFLASISLRKDGPDPMDAILAGKKIETDSLPGHFLVYNIAMQARPFLGMYPAEDKPSLISKKTSSAIKKSTK